MVSRREQIAFASGSHDIFVMSADGDGGPIPHSGIRQDPAWSPDGEWIAYVVAHRAPRNGVWSCGRTGPNGMRSGTRQRGRAFTPAWSPDSSAHRLPLEQRER